MAMSADQVDVLAVQGKGRSGGSASDPTSRLRLVRRGAGDVAWSLRSWTRRRVRRWMMKPVASMPRLTIIEDHFRLGSMPVMARHLADLARATAQNPLRESCGRC